MQNKGTFSTTLHTTKKTFHVALARNETQLITCGTKQTNNVKYNVFVL